MALGCVVELFYGDGAEGLELGEDEQGKDFRVRKVAKQDKDSRQDVRKQEEVGREGKGGN
jgi:hypothetical protein